MKTKCLKIDWLAPLVGVVLVAGVLVAATTYVDLERQSSANLALASTLDRLYQDQALSAALKEIHDGKTNAAAQRLDVLLCDHIVRINSEAASADAPTRTYVEDSFRRIARVRPMTGAGAVGPAAADRSEAQAEAEQILAMVLAGNHLVQAQ